MEGKNISIRRGGCRCGSCGTDAYLSEDGSCALCEKRILIEMIQLEFWFVWKLV